MKPASNDRRIQRFLKAHDMDQAALGWLLLHLAPTEAPYVLTLDRTEWHFGRAAVNVRAVGVACGDVAVPIAWTALPTAGGSGSEDQIQVLEAMLDVADPASVEALLADRGFDLEQTHLTAPGRIERLIGLLVLVWARLVSERRTQREGPPRRKSHGRR